VFARMDKRGYFSISVAEPLGNVYVGGAVRCVCADYVYSIVPFVYSLGISFPCSR
jgi:hypothetical protein